MLNGKLFLPHCTTSNSDTYHGDQWVTIEAEVHGSGEILHFVNGQQVMAYSEPQLDDRDPHAKKLATGKKSLLLESGTISLQSESHPVDFRKVELMVLPK